MSGPNEVEEAPGVAEFYSGPYLGWIDFSAADSAEKIPRAALNSAMDYLTEIVEEEGPFNGILGFSQGATMAFCYLLHQRQMRPFDPPFVPFACAVFISASGTSKDHSTLMEFIGSSEQKITIPTLHVYGKEDSDSEAAFTMFEHCKTGNAEFIMHPKGHVIPGDVDSVQQIVKAIKALGHKSGLY